MNTAAPAKKKKKKAPTKKKKQQKKTNQKPENGKPDSKPEIKASKAYVNLAPESFQLENGEIPLAIPIDRETEIPSQFMVRIDTVIPVNSSEGFRRFVLALDQQQATLENGHRVVNPAGAVKWIAEQINKGLFGSATTPSQQKAENDNGK